MQICVLIISNVCIFTRFFVLSNFERLSTYPSGICAVVHLCMFKFVESYLPAVPM